MITLTNTNHNTSITLRDDNGFLSPAQVRKARVTLCTAECTCSDNDLGTRGPQRDRKGHLIMVTTHFDGGANFVCREGVEIEKQIW